MADTGAVDMVTTTEDVADAGGNVVCFVVNVGVVVVCGVGELGLLAILLKMTHGNLLVICGCLVTQLHSCFVQIYLIKLPLNGLYLFIPPSKKRRYIILLMSVGLSVGR